MIPDRSSSTLRTSAGEVNTANLIPTADYDRYENLVAAGRITNTDFIYKFGAGVVSTSQVALRGQTTAASYSFPSSAVEMEVLSSSTDDTNSGGSGVRSVTVDLIDSSGELVTKTVNLNGTSAVAIPDGPYWRALTLRNGGQGTYGQTGVANVGTITLRTASGGATHATILPAASSNPAVNMGTSLVAAYSVPAGYQLHLHNIVLGSASTKITKFLLWQRNALTTTSAPFGATFVRQSYPDQTGTENYPYPDPVVFPSLSDVWVTAAVSSTPAAWATALLAFELRPNPS